MLLYLITKKILKKSKGDDRIENKKIKLHEEEKSLVGQRGKKILLTINNPAEKGYKINNPEDLEVFYEIIAKKWDSLIYMSCCKEIGLEENHTEHIHIFFEVKNAIRFNSIKKVFPKAHIDFCSGTSEEVDDYIKKQGKWLEDEKRAEYIEGFQWEIGEKPQERKQEAKKNQGKRTDLEDLKQMILDGKSNAEIYNKSAHYIKYSGSIDRVRNDLLSDKYKKEWRDLEVCYIHGSTGAGKTRGVMEKFGYENVYRVTDYDHPFDNYQNQDIIIFEEFRSSLKIQDMLNYLDGYPLSLPSRYSNRQACYHKVFIITNIPLNEQFVSVQENHIETYNAFLRRIHNIKVYENNEIYDYTQIFENEKYNYIREDFVLYFKEEKEKTKKENKTK